jgi:7-carboxy-7-deazaguanine synthase
MILNVSEIVSSIQGEGKYTGYPTTFVRLSGCNLNCEYCDTKYANSTSKRKRMSIPTILNYLFKMGNQHICITGGEPLLQADVYPLVYELIERSYKVSIETNGAVTIEDDAYLRSFSYCMDIKCPSSGVSDKNIYRNLEHLMSHDEVKFVVADINDYVFAKEVIRKYPTKASLIFSPVMGKNGESSARDLAGWLVEDKIPKARLGVQIHKLIGFY